MKNTLKSLVIILITAAAFTSCDNEETHNVTAKKQTSSQQPVVSNDQHITTTEPPTPEEISDGKDLSIKDKVVITHQMCIALKPFAAKTAKLMSKMKDVKVSDAVKMEDKVKEMGDKLSKEAEDLEKAGDEFDKKIKLIEAKYPAFKTKTGKNSINIQLKKDCPELLEVFKDWVDKN
jgi:hypothetical protein